MIKVKNLIFTSLIILSLSALPSLANNTASEVTFKTVMQGLLTDTQNITEGIVLEDFTLIEKAATNIVDHPKPDLAIRMKLVKAMGSQMGKFKAKDTVVHDSAVALVKAAQAKNMDAVTQEYQTLINGCLACHTSYKEKVANILK